MEVLAEDDKYYLDTILNVLIVVRHFFMHVLHLCIKYMYVKKINKILKFTKIIKESSFRIIAFMNQNLKFDFQEMVIDK